MLWCCYSCWYSVICGFCFWAVLAEYSTVNSGGTLSLLLVMCLIIKNLIYWLASIISERLSQSVFAVWWHSSLPGQNLFDKKNLNNTDREKKRGPSSWFLTPSPGLIQLPSFGWSVSQLLWQPEQTGNRRTDQLLFGVIYSNIYSQAENEDDTDSQSRQHHWALWVMSVLTKTLENTNGAGNV